MASFWYAAGLKGIMDGSIDLNSDDIRVALVMTNTTIDTENETIDYVDDFSTLDECDSAAYSRAALANESVALDASNNRVKFDADDVTFSSLASCTRQIQAVLIYYHDTNDAASIPLIYADITDSTPNGQDFTIEWDDDGIATLADSNAPTS